jgi:chorismate lyase/3-hydroxybenzoate synthase
MLTVEQPQPIDQDPAEVVRSAYRALYAAAKDTGLTQAVRIWQFMPGINEGHGDQERYRRFCVGRAAALNDLGLTEDGMCAATAIGIPETASGVSFRLMALFAKQPGRSIENPRQVSAWQYPRRYGPTSPAFARATTVCLNGVDDRHGLAAMVSGTAAVVGHASAHPGDVLAQTDEAMTNVEAVLKEASQVSDQSFGSVGASTVVRAYVRHADDWPRVAELIQQRWPKAFIMGLEGDVCRAELLVELEAWHPSESTHP